MARTTEAAVRLIIDTDVETAQVEAFIDDASGWVDDHLVGLDLSDATLTRIEKYLAAHLITLRDPRVRQSRVGDVSETLQRDTQVTEYLRTAAAMDDTGTVADRLLPDGPPKVRFRVGAGFDDDHRAVSS